MSHTDRALETLWDSLLSEDPHRINSVYLALAESERQAVLDHLMKMAESDGWLPSQRQSARIALEEIRKNKK